MVFKDEYNGLEGAIDEVYWGFETKNQFEIKEFLGEGFVKLIGFKTERVF